MKLHLPKALLAAALAASGLAGSHALAATTGTYTATCSRTPTALHNYTFTNDSTGATAVWSAAAANNSEAILHFTANSCTTANTVAQVQFDTFSVGGFIVDADTNVSGIGSNKQRTFILGHEGKTSASQINRNFELSPNSGLTLAGTQTWTVGDGATFSLRNSPNLSLNGSLTLDGAGNVDFTSQTLSGGGSNGARVTVSSGTLKNVTMAGGSTLVLGTNGTLSGVTMSSGSVLDLTERPASADAPLVSGVNISEGVTISLSEITAGSTVKISDTALDGINFIINGEEIVASRSIITQENGTFTFEALGYVYSDMVWAGGASGTWNTTETNWTSAASGRGGSIAFANDDSVTFNTSAEVTIGADVTVGSMTVSGNGTSVTLNTGGHTFTGEVSVQAESTLKISGSGFSPTRVSGAGGIVLNGDTSSSTTLELNTLAGFAGSISVNKTGGSGDDVGQTLFRLTHTNASGETFKDLTLSNSVQGENTNTLGGTVEILNSGAARTTTVKKLTVNGLGTIETKKDNTCYNGTIKIETLSGTNAVLNLRSGSMTADRTVFELGTASAGESPDTAEPSYTGTIHVVMNATHGSDRRVGLDINNSDIAKGAIIDLAQTTSNGTSNRYNQSDLGVNADNVTVRGITTTTYSTDASKFKATIVSGSLGAGAASSDNNVRTLTINTRESTDDFTANAAIKGNLNLVKKGEGKQTFSGDMTAFNKAVTVGAGELAFTNAAALNVTDLTVKSGATLKIGSPVQTLAAGAASATGVSPTGTVLLEGGSTITGGLNLTSTQTLKINNGADGSFSPITLEGALVLPTGGNIILDGDILTTLAWLGKDCTLNVFTGVTSLTLGNVAYTEATDLINCFTFDGLDAGSYSLGYTGAGGGVVYIQKNVPEPTTATLSLLALAALAARRRRKD